MTIIEEIEKETLIQSIKTIVKCADPLVIYN